MHDFNHDGKIDSRDSAFDYHMYENTKSGDHQKHDSSGNSSGNKALGYLIFFIFIFICALFGAH